MKTKEQIYLEIKAIEAKREDAFNDYANNKIPRWVWKEKKYDSKIMIKTLKWVINEDN